MDVVDEQGRLFGFVNVIDVLIVVLLSSVLVAGSALLLQDPTSGPKSPAGASDSPAGEGGSPASTETRYATVSFGQLPATVARTVDEGDRLRIGRAGTAPITDTYRILDGNGTAFVVVRTALTGHLREGRFVFGGQPVPADATASPVETKGPVNGSVVALESSGPRLHTRWIPLVLEATVPTPVANRLREGTPGTPGTADRVRGVTVESVTVFPSTDRVERRIHLGVRVRTLAGRDGPEFAGGPVTVGRNLTLATENATVDGTVLARGTLVPPGERDTVTVRVAWHDVDPSVADDVTVGTVERIGGVERNGGSVSARVLGKRVSPETVVATTDDGTLVARNHSRLRTVELTVALSARRTDAGLAFHGRRLLVGRPVVLDFGTVIVEGPVVGIERR